MAVSQLNAPPCAPSGVPRSGVVHYRVRQTANFTVIANSLAQRRGSAVTVGVAVYILSLPDGALITIAALSGHFDEGEILISRALRELEAAGFLERRCERGPDGRIRTRTLVYDIPGQGAPRSSRPSRPTAESSGPRDTVTLAQAPAAPVPSHRRPRPGCR